MSCAKCGHPVEYVDAKPVQGHNLGCAESLSAQTVSGDELARLHDLAEHLCEHPGCGEPRKAWSGRGAKPKYCEAGHKKEK